MFDVVMFLLENYMEHGVPLVSEKEWIVAELERIGFHKIEIDRALDWLVGLEQIQKTAKSVDMTHVTFRHYLPYEKEQIGFKGMGFLAYLEQVGVLDPVTREVVIDRLMALDQHEVDVARIQWVTLVALYNRPKQKAALMLLQDLILSDAFHQVH